MEDKRRQAIVERSREAKKEEIRKEGK